MVATVGVELDQTLLLSLAAGAPRGFRLLSEKNMEQEHHKGNAFRNCLTFLQKNRTATEPMDQFAASEVREGTLREMSVRWFMDTQAPIILRNGIFPSWFQGFITRKDAEKTLQDKELGSFLIRLSDKGPGYILSYKGNGRCRHFMISQDKTGHFIVSGDTKGHDALMDLIEFYKMNPIEPFGEYLTYSCFEECAEELYDMIQVSHQEKLPVNPRARIQPSTVAAQSRQNQEEIPPLPRRRRAHVDGCVSDSGSAPCGEEVSHSRPGKPGSSISSVVREGSKVPSESAPGRVSWLEPESTAVTPGNTSRQPSHHLPMVPTTTTAASTASNAILPHTVYSMLQPLEAKSASLPLLLDSPSEEDTTHRRNTPPPRPSPRSSPLGGGGGGGTQGRGKTPAGGVGGDGRGTRPLSSHSLDYLSTSPVYHLATAGRVDEDERSAGRRLFDDKAYEPLPAAPGDGPHRARPELRRDSHTYESLEDLRIMKPAMPSAGSNNDRRKRFPDLKRK